MKLHLICIGKLKDKNLLSVEQDYFKRIKLPFEISELKSLAEDVDKEAELVLKKIKDLSGKENPNIILLKENGKQFDSPKFSKWLYQQLEESSPVFLVIGGAAGHGKKILEKMKNSLSLGEMTYPHQLARVLLVEQIYRAETIHNNHPYHK